MNALSVHGGEAVFDKTSCKFGFRGQYGPVGIARLRGLEGGKSPEDMKPSSSASQSDRTDEQRGEVSREDVYRYKDGGGFRCFALRIAVRRYFMSLLERFISFFPLLLSYAYDRSSVSGRSISIFIVGMRCSNATFDACVDKSSDCTGWMLKGTLLRLLQEIWFVMVTLFHRKRKKAGRNAVVCTQPRNADMSPGNVPINLVCQWAPNGTSQMVMSVEMFLENEPQAQDVSVPNERKVAVAVAKG